MTRFLVRFVTALSTAAMLIGTLEAHAIRNPTPVAATDHLGLVGVRTSHGFCSGTLIGSNTVLTAAHCVCSLNWVYGNTCDSTADVEFRIDPQTGRSAQTITGTVSVHSGYEPSWTEQQVEHDIAIITLANGVAPAYAEPFVVADGFLSRDVDAMLIGKGFTGSDCSGPSGTWNWDFFPVYDYEDGHDIITFDGFPTCSGDSGGAVMDTDGTRIYGVHSMKEELWNLSKATTTANHFDWIKEHMCHSTARNRCNGQGDVCTCNAGTSLLWRETTGQLAIWSLSGEAITSQTYPGLVYDDWQVQGSGDFDADGEQDILWRHVTGQTAIWFMVGGLRVGEAYPGGPDPGGTWTIQSVGDFDGDLHSDILWRDRAGQLAIWAQGDSAQDAYPGYDNVPAPVDPSWTVLGVGDFDGDFRSDILWRHTSGQVSIWYMMGDIRAGEVFPGIQDPHRDQIQAIGDFDGNLTSDILWQDRVNGLLSIWFNGDNSFSSPDYPTYQNSLPDYAGSYDPSWKIQGVGDFDFDGRDDVLWRHSGGQLAIWLLNGMRFVGDLYPPLVTNGWKVEALLRPGLASTARSVPEPTGIASLLLGTGYLVALRRRSARRREGDAASGD